VKHHRNEPLDLHRWVYISHCRLPAAWSDTAVADIVAVSRGRNAPLDVTGALLFTGTRFAQIIEGSAAALAGLQASIERDPRHADVRTILSGPHGERLFDDWSLAYAGPSLFVASQVEAVLDDAPRSADRLVQTLRAFATPA
jgi:hypothetical protein